MPNIEYTEKDIVKKYPGILEILLIDRTTGKNILWGTSNYSRFGKGFAMDDYLPFKQLTNSSKEIIKPRIFKSKTEQKKRSKDMAEVFTPAWICNLQNNLIDEEWFGYKDAFNIQNDNVWERTDKVLFKGKNWKDYVDLERIEITCGEAPYLTSRYDVVNGGEIAPLDRVGLLDRKLRVVFENANNEDDYIENSLLALKRTYGYDFQGDNVLIARKNLLFSYIEFYIEKFGVEPTLELLTEAAKIISWNIWQMDGLKYVIPFSCHKEETVQLSLFEDMQEEPDMCKGCRTGNIHEHNGIYSKIKDWRLNKCVRFVDIIK